MPHPVDFIDAHRRHWTDAELLFDHDRWANADQLYGFSAECGLKAVMTTLGMPVDTHGIPGPEHRVHVQELWSIFERFAGDRGGARLLRSLPVGAPFSDWSQHDRYAHRRHYRPERVEPHREAARGIRGMVREAQQDGRP